jgi:spore germination protein GerM
MPTLPLMKVMILVILKAMFMLLLPALIRAITFPAMMILRQAMLSKIIKMLRQYMMISLEAKATLTMTTLGHSMTRVTLSPMMRTRLLCNGAGATLDTVETTTDTTWVIPTSAWTSN